MRERAGRVGRDGGCVRGARAAEAVWEAAVVARLAPDVALGAVPRYELLVAPEEARVARNARLVARVRAGLPFEAGRLATRKLEVVLALVAVDGAAPELRKVVAVGALEPTGTIVLRPLVGALRLWTHRTGLAKLVQAGCKVHEYLAASHVETHLALLGRLIALLGAWVAALFVFGPVVIALALVELRVWQDERLEGERVGAVALLPRIKRDSGQPDEAEAVDLRHADGDRDMALAERLRWPELRAELERAPNVANAVSVFVGEGVIFVDLAHEDAVAAARLLRGGRAQLHGHMQALPRVGAGLGHGNLEVELF